MADNSEIRAEAERYRRFLETLAAAPLSDVVGVVDAGGAGRGQSQGEEFWTLMFTLEVWRFDGGEVQSKPLVLRRQVTEEESSALEELIVPHEVIRVKARVVVDPASDWSQAQLEAFVGSASDEELSRHAEELHKPVIFEDPVFGAFTLHRKADLFVGEAVWAGESIGLTLSQTAEVVAALNTAHALWQDQAEWNRRVRQFARQELLPLKNSAWLDEDEAEVTPDEFEKRITLTSITVHPDGSFDFWHDDGDVFGGHTIQISGSLSEGPTHADIPG